jgi:hypothetical protein
MFVKWFSQKMVWTIFHIRFDSSTAEQAEQHDTNGRTPTNHGAIPHTTMMTTTHSTHAGPTPARSTTHTTRGWRIPQ